MSPEEQAGSGLEDLVGTTLADRYRVTRVLGSGGMGSVLRAEHLGLGRDVALKLLRTELAPVPGIEQRFEREARAIAALHHPNIVQVTDFGRTEDGLQYLVMELLEGHSLADMVGAPLPPARVVPLARQILQGLAHAHSRGIVHRDLKPENIFSTRDHDDAELLKIVDFGLAKPVGSPPASVPRDKLTQVGLAVGTPRYMSPEQVLGEEIDARGDLYAVGVLIYEMLSGHAPFVGDDLVETLRMQLTATHEPLGASVPPALATVVDRLLAKSKADRYASALEVLEALDAAEGEAVEASHDRFPTVAVPERVERVALEPDATSTLPSETNAKPVSDAAARAPRKIRVRRSRKPPVRGPIAAAAALVGVIVGWVFWEPNQASHRLEYLADRTAELFARLSNER